MLDVRKCWMQIMYGHFEFSEMKYDNVQTETKIGRKHVANTVNNNWLKFERDIFIGLGGTAFFHVDFSTFGVLRRPF